MDSKLVFLSGGGILALSLVFALVLSNSASNAGPNTQPSTLEECQTLRYNGENAINLVFMGPKKESEDYLNYLFSIEPFANHKSDFNAYIIDDSLYDPQCELYRGQALLCDNADVRKKAASCPNDFIFVFKDSGKTIRSSARGSTASLNSNANVPKNVIAHEFGHTFANFAEEYLGAAIPSGATNCPSSCDEFSGLEDGCYSGCSDDSHIRSIDNGIMRTLWELDNPKEPYGSFDANVIENEIQIRRSSKISGLAVQNTQECQDQRYILVEGIYNGDSIQINQKGIYPGCVGTNGNGDLTYSLIDSNSGKEVASGKFNANQIFTDGEESETGEITGDTYSNLGENFVLSLPINSQFQELIISDSNGNQLARTTLTDSGARPCRIQ